MIVEHVKKYKDYFARTICSDRLNLPVYKLGNIFLFLLKSICIYIRYSRK